jgi:hypothetical protein
MIPVLSILEIGAKLLDKVIPDKDAREKAQAELIKAAQDQDFQLALAQIKVNEEEAKSDNIFKSGWRPSIGWTCSVSFMLHFVAFPIVDKIMVALGHQALSIPFDMTTLMTVLGGLLGIGGLRTYEKVKGIK